MAIMAVHDTGCLYLTDLNNCFVMLHVHLNRVIDERVYSSSHVEDI